MGSVTVRKADEEDVAPDTRTWNEDYTLTKEDVELLLKNYNKCIALIKTEKERLDLESVYYQVIGDMRQMFPSFRLIMDNKAKIERGQVDLKERLHIFEQDKQFSQSVKAKYGQFGRKIFLSILENVLQFERKTFKQEGRLLSPRYFNKQDFPERVSSLIKGLV